MKKIKIGMICIIIASFSMTACGSTVPEMSEEQNAQIVEYAAGLLLKYDENYHGRLVELEEELVQAEEQTESREREPEPETEAPAPQEEQAAETQVVDRTQETGMSAYGSVDEFYGIEGVNITYAGYDVKDNYPDSSGSDELVLAMSATNGCKLLVLNFDVQNISGGDVDLDMLTLNTKFKISINGEPSKYVLTTMLMDDLSSYVGTIAAGATERLVLVSEIPMEKAASIQTLSLYMKSVSQDGTISLN